MKKLMSILLVVVVVFAVGCNDNNSNESSNENDLNIEVIDAQPIIEVEENHPIVTIEFENYEAITLELYPEIAPNTVNNFIDLAQSGYYNDLKFHRVIKDFMIQGGDPIGNGTGGPGYTIDAEFTKEKGPFTTYISHERGIVSMARSNDVNSAGSQFFIVHQDSDFLDLQYTAFGKVINNIEVVDEIANVKTGEYDDPEEDVTIKSIVIDLNGYEFSEPVINE
jgi:peptidyl-prolyl cis-trans isomerase B (cyclophilin B)